MRAIAQGGTDKKVRDAMRRDFDLTIGSVLHQMKDSALDAWPIADAEGLVAMVRSSDLEQAVEDGASNQRVAQILREDLVSGPTTAEDIPHVYPDHSLSLALERMGTSGLNVLPVVSRANLRQLIGIIALDDILNAYGVTKRGNSMERAEP